MSTTRKSRRLASEVFPLLAQPFKPDELEWRAGSFRFDKTAVMMLPYVTNRAIMDRLDEVIGPAYWSEDYRHVRENSKGWICTLTIQVIDEDERAEPGFNILRVYHEDAADETDIEPTKGGASDSMKRAAVKFGIGRYLYNLPQFWAPTVERGGKHYPDPKWTPTLPVWALPAGAPRPAPPPPPATAPAQPRPTAQPAKPAAPAAASSTRDDEDPDTGLPPGPFPFDIMTKIGVGQWKENPWSYLVMGTVGGRRHRWLQWASETWKPEEQRTKKVKALLAWMNTKAAKQENEANAKQDHREEPGSLTDDELAGLYPEGSQPTSIWDDPEAPPF